MWQELWFKMAGGDPLKYDKIKKTNVFEFYNLLKLWNDQVKTENESAKARRR